MRRRRLLKVNTLLCDLITSTGDVWQHLAKRGYKTSPLLLDRGSDVFVPSSPLNEISGSLEFSRVQRERLCCSAAY